VFRAPVILSGLGLVLAVALAWAFDLTPEGVRRAVLERFGLPNPR
jgi:hypothetical protein